MRRGVVLLVEGDQEVELVRTLDAAGTGVSVTRRCADTAELLAAVAAGAAHVAVVDSHLPGVDLTLVSRCENADVPVVVLASEGERDQWRRAAEVLRTDASPADVLSSVVAVLSRAAVPGQGARRDPLRTEPEAEDANAAGTPHSHARETTVTDGALHAWLTRGEEPGRAVTDLLMPADEAAEGEEREPGKIVAVWGTGGAPGRTTVAVNLAAELAVLCSGGARSKRRRTEAEDARAGRGDGRAVLVMDADTEGPAIAQVLGMLEDASSMAALARRAAHGRLTVSGLLSLSPAVRPGLRVATGLSRPDRWREMPPTSLAEVWEVARRAAQVTVVDVGAGAEEPPPGLDAWGAPPRHGATRSVLEVCDVVLVVGSADPVGVRRMIEALTQLREQQLAPDATVVPVVTKVRASAVGANPAQAVLSALEQYASIDNAVMIPDDREGLDACLLQGKVMSEAVPKSPARAPLREMASWLIPARVAA